MNCHVKVKLIVFLIKGNNSIICITVEIYTMVEIVIPAKSDC